MPLAAGLLVGGYEALRRSPVFGVDRVVVVGARGAAAEAIRERAATLVAGRSLLDVDPGTVAEALARLPHVQRVQVDRAFPGDLVVRVVPERGAGVIAAPGGRLLVGRSGRIIGPAPASTLLPDLAVEVTATTEPGVLLPRSAADQVRLAAALSDHRDLHVTGIIDGDSGLIARLAGGTELRLGNALDLDRKLVVAEAMLDRRPLDDQGEPLPLRYIDVSSPEHPALRGDRIDDATVIDADVAAQGAVPPGRQVDATVPIDVAVAIAQLFRPASQVSIGT